MNKQQLKELQELMVQYETIILHRHVRPDPDALGSQLGLKAALKKMYPNKQIFAVGEQVANLSFMGEMDEIEDEKYQQALVIVLDTANAPRIDDSRYTLGARLVKIDHHPPVDDYGDINIVDTIASSTSEIIYEIVCFFGYGPDYINREVAEKLYLGIVGDTGRFLFNNTTSRTMEIASKLLTYQIDHNTLLNTMQQRQLESIRFQGYVLQHFHFEEHVGWIFITPDVLKTFNISANDASLFVNSMADVSGIRAWIFAVDEGEQIRARLRSKQVVINTIAAEYNGGGHPLASGASVYSEEELHRLIQDVKSAVN